MKTAGAAMLFAPPRPPVWVPRSKPLVLGRAAECDVPVDSPRASRRHARVTAEGDRAVLEDLGSKNGTFVNGERIDGPRTLRPGDRIEVGGVAVTFCRVESVPVGAEGSDEATMVFDSAPSTRGEEALRGNLAEVPAAAVLQLLAEGGKTGLLTIVGPDSARVWFAGGRLVHAECTGFEGLPAALRTCGLSEGRFLFAPGRTAPAETIDLPVTALLLEANRLADERAHAHSG